MRARSMSMSSIIKEGNNGGYANDWLVGDRKTGEIAYLELGLKNTPLWRIEGWLLCQLQLCPRSRTDQRPRPTDSIRPILPARPMRGA